MSNAFQKNESILSIRNISKNYDAVQALKNINMDVRRGSIHGLLGENGAGKSTLVGIISGQIKPSLGKIILNNEEIHNPDVKSMEEKGVFLVTQEPMIIDNISAEENLMLGVWPSKAGFINWKKLKKNAAEMLKNSDINPNILAGKLDAVARRKINILRALFSGGKVIILDEPTAALTVPDRNQLFTYMRQLKETGVTFIFISHYNDEILDICDSVSVLRDGIVAGTRHEVSKMSSDDLTELVLGRNLNLFQRERRNYTTKDDIHISLNEVKGPSINVSKLDIYKGEVIGFTGLPGAGAKEIAKAIFGLHPVEEGYFSLDSAAKLSFPNHPKSAFDLGIAYLSDDRRKDGFIENMSISENISLSSLHNHAKNGFINKKYEKETSDNYFKSMEIKAPSSASPVGHLSGGNQQKVCLGRVLATQPKLLILDEPTRGIDIGVKQDVLRIINDLSNTGISVIIVSTDTDELTRAVDRVCVFQDGTIKKIIVGDDITTENLRSLSN